MAQGLYSEARYYDIIYQNKDYENETKLIVKRFEESDAKLRKAIVLGCGTGKHSRELEKEGFDVLGLDEKEEMLERARKKSDAEFRKSRLPEINTDEEFGVVVAPFGVINYLNEEKLENLLDNIREIMTEDGILIFDNGDYDIVGEESDTMLEVFQDEDVGRVGKT